MKFLYHPQTFRDTAEFPAYPSIRAGHPRCVAAIDRQVACCIEGEGPPHDSAVRDFFSKIATGLFVHSWMCTQYERLPAKCRQVLNEAQGTLYTATSGQRRKVKSHHQDALQR